MSSFYPSNVEASHSKIWYFLLYVLSHLTLSVSLQIGARFPVVNGLLNVIRRKKSKDTYVMSGVVAACLLLIIIYLFAR